MYTEDDLKAVEQAIRDLALGERITRVTINGRTVQKAEVDLPQLRQLRAEIARQVRPGRSRPVRVNSEPGLR
ncbi:gpW family protein [Halorhodospira sp. 9622]|uniref:gpW family protein n=1 Tax=Halorhodospira sp. 9622 TaxID=2899136 RepID=UPI001EE8EFEE|nr:gpW family protein [Halorhodospira sp. 9622]MCG5538954.1 gpW family protein [Halorhodospira sp. 9622]